MAGVTCPHGFPKPANCVDCMYDDGVGEPDVWATVGSPTVARFVGACPCGDEILAGDEVQRWDRGSAGREETRYCHWGCRP